MAAVSNGGSKLSHLAFSLRSELQIGSEHGSNTLLYRQNVTVTGCLLPFYLQKETVYIWDKYERKIREHDKN